MPKGEGTSWKGKGSSKKSVPLSEADPMSDHSDLTVDALKLWSVTALQTFLAVRKKSIDGKHETLAARAFVAWEENVVVDSNQEHKLRANLADYKTKLRLTDGILPDPFTLKDGWVGEEAITNWPQLSVMDIAEYLKEATKHDIYRKLMNEYKLASLSKTITC